MIPKTDYVKFEDISEVSDSLLKFAVIACRYQGQWIFCQHKERDTWEIPGGRREIGEAILDTARRELYEETGALEFGLQIICAYSVGGEERSYGLLCCADIKTLGELPVSEIKRVWLTEDLPDSLTYPLIQPYLFAMAQSWFL